MENLAGSSCKRKKGQLFLFSPNIVFLPKINPPSCSRKPTIITGCTTSHWTKKLNFKWKIKLKVRNKTQTKKIRRKGWFGKG